MNQSYTIESVNYAFPAAKALVDMGLTKGTVITIVGKAPLGDPLLVNIRDYQLALRKHDLKAFTLKPVTSKGV